MLCSIVQSLFAENVKACKKRLKNKPPWGIIYYERFLRRKGMM